MSAVYLCLLSLLFHKRESSYIISDSRGNLNCNDIVIMQNKHVISISVLYFQEITSKSPNRNETQQCSYKYVQIFSHRYDCSTTSEKNIILLTVHNFDTQDLVNVISSETFHTVYSACRYIA